MSIISDVVVDYLLAQIDAGAQVVQLFDSWVGWLGPYDYELLVLPHVRYVIDKVKGHGAPVIYFGNGASAMLHHVAKAGSEVIGVDWRIELDRAWDQLGDVAVQGNLDPITLLGPPKAIEARVADIIGARRRPPRPHLQPRPRPRAADAAGQRQVPRRRGAPPVGRARLNGRRGP